MIDFTSWLKHIYESRLLFSLFNLVWVLPEYCTCDLFDAWFIWIPRDCKTTERLDYRLTKSSIVCMLKLGNMTKVSQQYVSCHLQSVVIKQDVAKQIITLTSKFKLYKSLVVSILLNGFKTRTLLADSNKKIQVFETKRLRKSLSIFYLEDKTNDWVRSKIKFLVGLKETLLVTLKRWKLVWFGHVTRHHRLSKTTFQGTLEGGRRRGQQWKRWRATLKSGRPRPCQNCSRWPPA